MFEKISNWLLPKAIAESLSEEHMQYPIPDHHLHPNFTDRVDPSFYYVIFFWI